MAETENPFGGAPFGGAPFGPIPEPDAVNNNVAFNWWPVGQVARPIVRPAPLGGQPFVPAEATRENTTNRVWPLTQGEVARPILRPAGFPGGQPFVPAEATLENTRIIAWPMAFGEVARPILRPAPLGGLPFVPAEATVENTTLRVWPPTFGEVARPILRPAPLGGQPFVPIEELYPNTVNRVWPLTQGEIARPIVRPAPPGWVQSWYPHPTYEPFSDNWLPSREQAEAYWRRVRMLEAERDRQRAAARDLERRLTEALKWAYVEATDPEVAAALRAAIAAAAPEDAALVEMRNQLEAKWYALQESIEATERFVDMIEDARHRQWLRQMEDEDVELLLLAGI